jgi:hypothetical protein
VILLSGDPTCLSVLKIVAQGMHFQIGFFNQSQATGCTKMVSFMNAFTLSLVGINRRLQMLPLE